MNMPEPTMPPITSIVASNNPKRAARARRGSASGCKGTAGASRDGVESGKKQRAHEVRRLADYTSRRTTVALVAKSTTAIKTTSIRQPHRNQALLKCRLPANNLVASLVHAATGKVTSAGRKMSLGGIRPALCENKKAARRQAALQSRPHLKSSNARLWRKYGRTN